MSQVKVADTQRELTAFLLYLDRLQSQTSVHDRIGVEFVETSGYLLDQIAGVDEKNLIV